MTEATSASAHEHASPSSWEPICPPTTFGEGLLKSFFAQMWLGPDTTWLPFQQKHVRSKNITQAMPLTSPTSLSATREPESTALHGPAERRPQHQ